eukprot:scaffold805_cov251-Pinguiococcus_pyrenoidosus.AAC.9
MLHPSYRRISSYQARRIIPEQRRRVIRREPSKRLGHIGDLRKRGREAAPALVVDTTAPRTCEYLTRTRQLLVRSHVPSRGVAGEHPGSQVRERQGREADGAEGADIVDEVEEVRLVHDARQDYRAGEGRQEAADADAGVKLSLAGSGVVVNESPPEVLLHGEAEDEGDEIHHHQMHRADAPALKQDVGLLRVIHLVVAFQKKPRRQHRMHTRERDPDERGEDGHLGDDQGARDDVLDNPTHMPHLAHLGSGGSLQHGAIGHGQRQRLHRVVGFEGQRHMRLAVHVLVELQAGPPRLVGDQRHVHGRRSRRCRRLRRRQRWKRLRGPWSLLAHHAPSATASGRSGPAPARKRSTLSLRATAVLEGSRPLPLPSRCVAIRSSEALRPPLRLSARRRHKDDGSSRT